MRRSLSPLGAMALFRSCRRAKDTGALGGEVRTGLAGGGKRIRTFGPPSRRDGRSAALIEIVKNSNLACPPLASTASSLPGYIDWGVPGSTSAQRGTGLGEESPNEISTAGLRLHGNQ